MKRHKKVLFEQIKEEQQSKRKKKPSAAYYFATDAVWNILKVVLVVVGFLVLSVAVSVIATAINNGQAPDAAVLSFWVTIVSNCAIYNYLGTNSVKTREDLVKRLGKTTITEENSSRNTGGKQGGGSLSDRGVGRELLTVDELAVIDAENKNSIVLMGGRPFFCEKFRTQKHPLFSRIGNDIKGSAGYADMRRQGYRLPSERNEDLSDVYCYCYRKDMLDAHMRQAERGISFLDEHYEERFRLPDGGRMRVTYANDDRQDFVCRYVDDYHFEMGTGSDTCCHINQFAEKMAQCGCLVEPLDKMPEQKKEEQIVFSCDGKNYFAEIEIWGQMERCPIRCVNGVRRFDRLNQQVKREVVYSFTTSDGVVHQLSPENTNRYKEFVEQTVKSQAVLEQAMQTDEPSEEVKAKAL